MQRPENDSALPWSFCQTLKQRLSVSTLDDALLAVHELLRVFNLPPNASQMA